MRLFPIMVLCMIAPEVLLCQQYSADSSVLNLQDLIDEALRNNPEIRASALRVDAAHARVGEAGTVDDPELTYTREGMPGFHWNEAQMQKIGLMQGFRFPGKLSTQTDIAEINAEHSHHNHLEKELEVITRLKSTYYELWFVQQSVILNRENARLIQQFTTIAKTKFGTGEAALQDVLKANVELARVENLGSVLHQQEESSKAMLISLLNRQPGDTLGVVVLPDTVEFRVVLDTLQQLALQTRPMLLHDSLMVEESRFMLSLSKSEYLPDFKLGVEYVTVPVGYFRGWSISAGITLPFAPWTLGKAGSREEEASAGIGMSSATLNASRNMVLSNVKDLYFKVQSAKRQFDSYHTVILPQARQSLNASVTAYQNGRTDFLMLIDAYRTLVELSMESLMARTQFEQSLAELERQVGVPEIASHK